MFSIRRAGILVVAALAAGCGGTSSAPSSSGSSGASSSASSTSAPAAPEIRERIEERCGFDAEGSITAVPVDGESTLAVARLGEGSTAMVMLPQVSGGMCGALPWAGWAVTQEKVVALAVDMCGDGDSECGSTAHNDPLTQVKAVVAWAREEAGAERVVVVGASAGGSIALGFAQQAGADAVVDLSGPANWTSAPEAEEAAAATTIPLLIVADNSEAGIFPARLRKAVAGSPAQVKQYLAAPDGHGWSMLSNDHAIDPEITDVGKDVLAWVLKPSAS